MFVRGGLWGVSFKEKRFCVIQRDVVFHSKGVWCSIQRGCGVSFKGVVIIQRSGGHSKGVLLAGDVSRGGDVSFNMCDILVGVVVGWAAVAAHNVGVYEGDVLVGVGVGWTAAAAHNVGVDGGGVRR